MKGLRFESVEEAEKVLRPYKIRDRIAALVLLGVDVFAYTREELAECIGASRSRVSKELHRGRIDIVCDDGSDS